MLDNSIVLQRPTEPPSSLVLLTHGVGSRPDSMLPVGALFAAHDATSMVVSVASAYQSDISNGYQWFSVRGITEENRQERVDAAMAAFLSVVGQWQKFAQLGPEATRLVGFSQGAIMALESTKLVAPPALSIVALAGRFASLPTGKSAARIHFVHGARDEVVAPEHSLQAMRVLSELGGHTSLDVLPELGHQPHPDAIKRLLR